jgi:hypothetical protein
MQQTRVSPDHHAEPARKGDWMMTASGLQFWPLDPRVDEIEIGDIATGLAHQGRYNGQTSRFYSVAQHSIHLADYFSARSDHDFARWALLHDAAEAYIGDMIRPLKPIFLSFLEIESRIERCIFERFDLKGDIPQAVKDADTRILTDEFIHLFPTEAVERHGLHKRARLGINVARLTPGDARALFLHRFERLF